MRSRLKTATSRPVTRVAGMVPALGPKWRPSGGDGIAAYCHPEHKISPGLVAGLNNKIRVIQRSAYGYRDEDYLKIKIIASFLPALPENARLHLHQSAMTRSCDCHPAPAVLTITLQRRTIMAGMNIQRSLPWLIAAAALAGALGLFLGQKWFGGPGVASTQSAIVYPQPRPLGDFRLQRADTGAPFTLTDWQGQWSLVFIGFTHCPDACPQTLALYRDIERLWREQGRGAPPTLYFVSVDPERDTAQALVEYAHYFSPTIVPVMGEHAQLEPFAKQLNMFYLSRPIGEDDYTVDHTTYLVLVDPQARLKAFFRAPMSAPAIVADLLALGAGDNTPQPAATVP